MTYSEGTTVKLVAGRLALDFLNTADWSAEGTILKDRITALPDLLVWQKEVGLPKARWEGSIAQLHEFRMQLRSAILGGSASGLELALAEAASPLVPWLRHQSLRSLITISALSVLADQRELSRVKQCPGHDCGWIFLDETKNSRRKWCLMEVCGNRAKSARHDALKISE